MQLKSSLKLISLIFSFTSVVDATDPSYTTMSYPTGTVITTTTTQTVTYTQTIPYNQTITYCPPTSTPAPTCPLNAGAMYLRRMWRGDISSHFYSTYGPEVAYYGTQAYVEETPQGRLYPVQQVGTVPLWRCIESGGTPQVNYFYTANAAEFQARVAGGCQAMGDPAAAGVAQEIGYLYTSQVCGSVPLYRLYSASRFDNFYTINSTERQNNINNGLYADQGIVGYVLPN
ncbi:hypothetical protein NP233_g9815 [Leucocoprinus birnbaumii]|uniref:DUF5648 domain-containing protein n=1 Tax=Leucocoprinus birnbaumii TaxID=56174 RepID=A0AAD5VJR4_9AGAR|nr:hypothetical protein NP233_g9815 [Leucocoprinus birnbaumii]